MILSLPLSLFAALLACVHYTIGESSTCSASGQGGAGCHEHVDNATTVHEIGLDALSRLTGNRPTAWRETYMKHTSVSYGQVNRLQLFFGSDEEQRFVVKRFNISSKDNPVPFMREKFSDPEVWSLVKQRWYDQIFVEAAAYTHLWEPLLAAGLAVPRLLYMSNTSAEQRFITFVSEDLLVSYPVAGYKNRIMSKDEMYACTKYLARFHALFWEQPQAVERGRRSRGNFWHLDDLQSLMLERKPKDFTNKYISNRDWQRLRNAAKAVDSRLAARPLQPQDARHAFRFRTLIHGDVQPENLFCTHMNAPPDVRCALLDFSWVGEGYAACDLVRFLSQWTRPVVDLLTKHYHEVLMKEIGQRGEGFTLHVLWQQFELCMVDFVRYSLVDDSLGLTQWNMDITKAVLQRLDGGKILKKSSYARKVEKHFPWT